MAHQNRTIASPQATQAILRSRKWGHRPSAAVNAEKPEIAAARMRRGRSGQPTIRREVEPRITQAEGAQYPAHCLVGKLESSWIYFARIPSSSGRYM